MKTNLSKFIGGGLITVLPFFFSTSACTKKQEAPAEPLTTEQLVEKGHKIYVLNCVSCHGPDPKKEGNIGPEIWGSNLDLLTARLMRAEYPPSYKAKRSTKIMVSLPHLQADLPAIHAFLNK